MYLNICNLGIQRVLKYFNVVKIILRYFLLDFMKQLDSTVRFQERCFDETS